MCDTALNHNTGWRIVRISREIERGWVSYLYLQCRTKHCIETRTDKRTGLWYSEDFD